MNGQWGAGSAGLAVQDSAREGSLGGTDGTRMWCCGVGLICNIGRFGSLVVRGDRGWEVRRGVE